LVGGVSKNMLIITTTLPSCFFNKYCFFIGLVFGRLAACGVFFSTRKHSTSQAYWITSHHTISPARARAHTQTRSELRAQTAHTPLNAMHAHGPRRRLRVSGGNLVAGRAHHHGTLSHPLPIRWLNPHCRRQAAACLPPAACRRSYSAHVGRGTTLLQTGRPARANARRADDQSYHERPARRLP